MSRKIASGAGHPRRPPLFQCPLLLAALCAAFALPALSAPPPGRTISSPKLGAVRGGQPKTSSRYASPPPSTTAYTGVLTPKSRADAKLRSESPRQGSRATSRPPARGGKVAVGPPAVETVKLSQRGNGLAAYLSPPRKDTPSAPRAAATPGVFARVDVGSLGERVKALNLQEAPAVSPGPTTVHTEVELPALRTPEQVIADAVAAQKAAQAPEPVAAPPVHDPPPLARDASASLAKPTATAPPPPPPPPLERRQRWARRPEPSSRTNSQSVSSDPQHADGGHPDDMGTCHELFVQTLTGSELTDCEFVLDDGSGLRAHRCLLSTKGGAFRDALAAGGAKGVMHVEGTSLGSLRAFVQYLYVGEIAEVAMEAAEWHEVWRLAERYQVAPLKSYLAGHVDAGSAARAAEVAADASETELLEACCAFAAASLPRMGEAGLRGVRAGVALNLMVGHESPAERFRFAARWCRANGKKCGDDDVLTLLRGVELDRLTMPELVDVVRPSGLLTADMLLDVYEQRLKTDAWGDSRFDVVQHLRLYDGDPDSGLRPPSPSGIALFSDGRIVVCDSANAKVQMLSYDGRFIREYGPGAEFGHNHLVQPSGVAVGRRGQVIVTDRATNSVQIFTETGCFLRSFGTMGDGEGQFRGPHSVAVHPARGDLVVTDEFNHRVQVFDVHGNVKRVFGHEGDGNGEFRNPTGVAVSWDGNIVVADCGNARVQIFSPEGHFIRAFGSRGEGPARFRSITGVSVARNGDIVVCDPYSDSRRLQVFDTKGVYLQSIGSYEPDQRDPSPGEAESSPPPTLDVGRPRGIAVDGKGTVFVTDANENRISAVGFPDGSMASREQRGGSPGASLVGVTGAKETVGK
eukprot:CAMPEP_0173470556 /NCGR_PEP_ID=MMETSP1357-20121228/77937_1 /TAXON_ID=77926 /ORGANISM="Hemiselmis rufescens, Strain PCC563" /LENGTH=861 /DNA_ID=CAMNT_0014438837 /DNA_START=122 /DNA_END=2707 /DNA_ORIENTATION=-